MLLHCPEDQGYIYVYIIYSFWNAFLSNPYATFRDPSLIFLYPQGSFRPCEWGLRAQMCVHLQPEFNQLYCNIIYIPCSLPASKYRVQWLLVYSSSATITAKDFRMFSSSPKETILLRYHPAPLDHH